MPPVIANAVKQSRRKTPTNSPVLDCFVPRNDGAVVVVVRQSPVIANVVKQSRGKTPTNSPILDCFVPRNDGAVIVVVIVQGTRLQATSNKQQATGNRQQAGKPRTGTQMTQILKDDRRFFLSAVILFIL
jgi:hypothetical protein